MIQSTCLPDFDVLVALYRDDPEAFNAFRKHLLRSTVEQAPPEYRPSLEQLLLRMEATRDAADNSMEAAAAAFHLMCDSTNQLHSAWEKVWQTMTELHAMLLIERIRTR